MREENSLNNFKDLQARLEKTYQTSLESHRQESERALKAGESKCSSLEAELKSKDDELVNLLKRYQKLAEEFQTLTKQEANKKSLTLKYAGANAEILASKNLFDVYLKKKVLQECGSALQEKQSNH